MKMLLQAAALCAVLCGASARAETATVCTIVTDAATGQDLVQEGDCDRRVPPASTFKIAISLMGFDAGILEDAQHPELPFHEGYADWIEAWRTTQTPASWMRNSVVWYSQQVTQRLGMDAFRDYVDAFEYGNEDVSGDPGRDNGLTDAWLGASLLISPEEQAAFLGKLANGELPVSDHAREQTARIIDQGMQPGGWQVFGKTGSLAPRGRDGSFLPGRRIGWFVGWADKGDRRVVFARLIEDSERQPTPAGPRARDALLRDLFASPEALD